MKNRKFLLLLIISICSVSLASAQGYVDDLYYSRQTKAEREAELKRQQLKLVSQKEKRESKIDVRQYDDEYVDEDSDDEEYYPGMFADVVNGNKDNASKRGREDRSSGGESKIRVEIVSVWSPSWYSYSSWGGSYYSPWGRSMWHDPFDPFYSYGWGYNSCYSGWYGWQGHGWRGCNPHYYGGSHNSWNHGWNGGWNNGWHGGWNSGWNNGWNNNHYYGGGYGYSAPKYNRNNTVVGGGRRPGSTMVGSNSSSGRYNNTSSRGGNYTISNRLERDTRSNTRVNGNSTGNRYNTNSNRTNSEAKPSQYNRRDTYTPPPTTTTTRQSGTSTGTSTGSYQRGGNSTGSGGTGTGTGNSGGGTVVHSTRRR